MKSTALTGLLTAAVLIPLTAGAQPRPGHPTTAPVITKAESDKIAATMQNVTTRDVTPGSSTSATAGAWSWGSSIVRSSAC